MVGAVLVRRGRIVGTGYHQRAGSDHAEILALKRAGPLARRATLYINLEPCHHQGRTPPCTEAVIRSGVERVVVGMADPNPLVSRRGIQRLRRAGISVRVGVLGQECQKLNEAFSKFISRRIPFVILKLAASLDGRIATFTGDSRWVTGTAARNFVHRLRNQVDAVLVGVETVMADDPMLTCRLPGGRNPWRVVLDSRLRIPLAAKVLHRRGPGQTVVVVGPSAPITKVEAIERRGAHVWRMPLRKGSIPFPLILKRLGKMGFLSVMIEGGGDTAARALADRIVDKTLFFYAPKIVGGEGRAMVGALGLRQMRHSKRIENVDITRFDEDLLVTGYVR
jgi:diaminohydroxyphosphoribosylaminopyrimidine deaminase/5-amino-6-(5-phosphoribosylamino)uracil reductase